MKLQLATTGSNNLIQLSGDLDIYNAGAARELLMGETSSREAVELDLGGIDACDAAGIQLVCACRNSAVAAGKSFRLINPSPAMVECGRRLGFPPTICSPHNP